MEGLDAAIQEGINKIVKRIESIQVTKNASWAFPQIVLASDYAQLKKAGPEVSDFFKRATKIFLKIAESEIHAKLDTEIIAQNLVDTGNLKSSLTIDLRYNVIDITYDAPYADLLHYGGYIRPYGNPNAKKVYIPGRPWVENVLNAYDFGDAFMRALDQTT